MIAVDTNVLVRLLTLDDTAQAAKAQRVFDKASAGDGGVWIADTVLVETLWTLACAHDRPRTDLVAVLRALAGNATIIFESPAAVRQATEQLEGGPADFADCLLCAKAMLAGCTAVATFDRGMKRLPGVRLL